MLQRASHRPRNAENRVLTEASSSGIVVDTALLGGGFLRFIFYPSQYYSINAPYSYFFTDLDAI
jgi:hypothetical protein